MAQPARAQQAPGAQTILFGPGSDPDISGDFLAYECPQDTVNPDFSEGNAGICVHNIRLGTMTRVTNEGPGEDISDPSVSHNGDFVAFLLDDGSGPRQLYLADLNAGGAPVLISAAPDGTPGNLDTDYFDLVSDRYYPNEIAIVFYSHASNLVSGDTNSATDAFLWRSTTGTTERVSLAYDGSQAQESVGYGGVTGGRGAPGVMADRCASGICLPVEDANRLVVFDAGRYVESLVANDNNDEGDVFLRDRVASTTIRLSENAAGDGGDCDSHSPTISQDGRFVAFYSCAYNLGIGTLSDEVVVMELETGELTSASVTFDGTEPDNDSAVNEIPILSRDGRFVLFDARASNLVVNDSNGGDTDVFLRDRGAGETWLVSVDETGQQIDRPIDQTMNETGRMIAWSSTVQQPDGSYLPVIWLRDRGDVRGPQINNIQAPKEAPLNDIIELIAVADDRGRGDQDVTSAQYRVDNGAWSPMEADDAAFDSPVENIVSILETSRLGSGVHEICLRAFDSAGNAELPECIEVDIAPPLADLRVRCTHDPVWPQPLGSVTVTAEALTASVLGGVNNNDITPLTADRISIIVLDNGTISELGSANGVDTHSESISLTFSDPGFVTYGCLVEAGGSQRFSGWRQLGVGYVNNSVLGAPIPVIYNGSVKEKIDIVFIPDEDDYSGPEDTQFQQDTLSVIRDGYYNFPLFLLMQDRFNFWIASSTGNAQRGNVFKEDACVLDPPFSWSDEYSFADVGAILHTNTFRDCASNNRFSTEPGSLGTLLHETGHQPFGLADEYCNQSYSDGTVLKCDGGYFQKRKFPNVYRELGPCEDDAEDLGRDASDCRLWTQTPFPQTDWATSEPNAAADGSDAFGTIDLMVDRGPPSAADIRRILWMLRRCEEGKC